MNEQEKRHRERALAHYEAPLIPGNTTGVEHRVASALEYIAYQLYDIRESQRRLSGRQQNPPAPEGE